MNYFRNILSIKTWNTIELRPDRFIITRRMQDPFADFTMNRIQFYKVFHLTAGTGLLIAGLRRYVLTPGDVAFIHPNEFFGWAPLSLPMDGHFCFVHPRFLKDAKHVLEMFMTFPHAHPREAVVPLNRAQSGDVRRSFESIYEEASGSFSDKQQAILLHLQMILLKVRRAGKTPGFIRVG